MTTEENIQRAQQLFEEKDDTSIRRGAQQLGISKSRLQDIVRHKIDFYPYKIQLYQQLTDHDVERRFNFANVMIEKIERWELDPTMIWFTDEAHFHLRGFVNKQNWRHWGSENPHIAVAKPLHSERVTVWCALSSTSIIGPIFIEGNVTAEKYKRILEDNFLPEIRRLRRVRGYWFQQDGARPHRTAEVFDSLIDTFGNRIIGLDIERHTEGGIEWPPYSPDITPLDYFLWGYLKDRVFSTAPDTIDELKLAIKREVEGIRSEVLKRVIDSFQARLHHLITTGGGNFENLFH